MNIVLFSDADCATPDCINGGFVFYKNDERYLHIKKVLHLKEGDVFKAGIINGKISEALISHLSEEKILFSFCPNKPDKVETRPLPLPPIKIILGFPRPIQLRRILRDAASLGFAEIVLCGTDLGERSYLKSNLSSPEEIKKYLLDGISQAGQTMLPDFSFCGAVKEALKNLKTASFKGSKVLLDIGDFPSLSTFRMTKGESILIAIGSERGWTQNEREAFFSEGFISYSMGKRILRTETALTSALSVLLANNGFWD